MIFPSIALVIPKTSRAKLLSVKILDVFNSRVVAGAFPRASICLDFTIHAGLIKCPIVYSTGQSSHYTINLVSMRGVLRKDVAIISHGAIVSWLRRRKMYESVQI